MFVFCSCPPQLSPAEFEAIKSEAFRQQQENGGEDSEVDFVYDIPIDLAAKACGYRTGEDPNAPFAELRRKGGVLSRLFGR